MEKYKDCELDIIALFDENIDILIDEAFSNLECESITKLSNTQWKYILAYIGMRLFPDNRLFKDENRYIYNNSKYPTNNNAYDYDIIYKLCIRYIILCYKYNKVVSLIGFSLLLNIPITSIQNWNNVNLQYNNDSSIHDNGMVYGNDDNDIVTGNHKRVSYKPIDIYNILLSAREGILKDIAVDSKQVVGTLAVANNEFGWNVPGMTGKTDSVRSLSAAELPKLEMSNDK